MRIFPVKEGERLDGWTFKNADYKMNKRVVNPYEFADSYEDRRRRVEELEAEARNHREEADRLFASLPIEERLDRFDEMLYELETGLNEVESSWMFMKPEPVSPSYKEYLQSRLNMYIKK